MQIFGDTLTAGHLILLVLALALAFGFEFVNGFHDTANAVATVIYTHSLKPTYAVVWSGMWNLLGVLTSSGAVAFSIVALLPVELVLNVGSGPSFAMVFALLISAIMWNLGTWYLGLPASSSHTLIGSIMGVGLANSLISQHVFGEGVNWGKVREVFTSLLVSPVVGFLGAALLLVLFQQLLRRPELYAPAESDKTPPPWIRGLLILTCTGVSFAHGSNDGQKGMGLIVLILVGLLPGIYSLNMDTDAATIQQLLNSSQAAVTVIDRQAPKGISLTNQDAKTELSDFLKTTGKFSDKTFPALATTSREIQQRLSGKDSFKVIPKPDRLALRSNFYLVDAAIGKLNKAHKFTNPQDEKIVTDYQKRLDKETKFIPDWVKVGVALSLGLGTMIGWKRIVVTVGEKIGKQHLSYGQGASAELMAMSTIFAADHLGLPVSTTHVLSSGIAGTMWANKSGLQASTLRNIALAWILTLPVCVLLGAALYSGALFVTLRGLGAP